MFSNCVGGGFNRCIRRRDAAIQDDHHFEYTDPNGDHNIEDGDTTRSVIHRPSLISSFLDRVHRCFRRDAAFQDLFSNFDDPGDDLHIRDADDEDTTRAIYHEPSFHSHDSDDDQDDGMPRTISLGRPSHDLYFFLHDEDHDRAIRQGQVEDDADKDLLAGEFIEIQSSSSSTSSSQQRRERMARRRARRRREERRQERRLQRQIRERREEEEDANENERKKNRKEFLENIVGRKTVVSTRIEATSDANGNNCDDVNADIILDEHDTPPSCPICLTDYKVEDIVGSSQNSSCQHMFHRSCILTWLEDHDKCPCCRVNYLELSENVKKEVGGVDDLGTSPHQLQIMPQLLGLSYLDEDSESVIYTGSLEESELDE